MAFWSSTRSTQVEEMSERLNLEFDVNYVEFLDESCAAFCLA